MFVHVNVCKTGKHPCWEDEAAPLTLQALLLQLGLVEAWGGQNTQQNTLTLVEDTTKLRKKPLNDE